MLGHQTRLNKYKSNGIIQSMFSDKNKIKLEPNNKKLAVKSPNIWKLKDTFLNKKPSPKKFSNVSKKRKTLHIKFWGRQLKRCLEGHL